MFLLFFNTNATNVHEWVLHFIRAHSCHPWLISFFKLPDTPHKYALLVFFGIYQYISHNFNF